MTRTHFRLVLSGLLIFGMASTSGAQESRFDQWDADHSGKLTREELPENARKNFDRVDANSDGFISREEDASRRGGAARPATRQRRPDRAAPSASEGIRIERDVAYAATDRPDQRLDVYLPERRASDRPLPVLVWIHGGGWRNGSKEGGIRNLSEMIASGKYVGFSVEYRLSGEAIWPAQIHDCKAAIRWIKAHGDQYQLDPERIGIWGSSAGGHLVAMLGTSGDVETIEGTVGSHTDQSSRVACVVDYFGPTDFLSMDDFPSKFKHDGADSPESLVIGGPIQENKQAVRTASPLTYVSSDDPPILIVHGTVDPLVPIDQSVQLDTALRKANVDVTFIRVDGAGHGGFNSTEVLDRVERFFAKHLLGKASEIAGGVVKKGQERQ